MRLPRRLILALVMVTAASTSLRAQAPELVEGLFRLRWQAPPRNGTVVLERSSDLEEWKPARAASFGPGDTVTLRDVSSSVHQGYYRVREAGDGADQDGDGITDGVEIGGWPALHPLNPAKGIDAMNGAVALASDAHFQELAFADLTNPEFELREVKFLVAGLAEGDPKIWFMNTATHRSHSLFANQVLGIRDFLQFGYAGSRPRKYFAGTLVHRPNFVGDGGKRGVYLLESLPNDPIDFAFMSAIFDLVSVGAPDLEAPIAYHPSGDIQRALWREELSHYRNSFVRVATDEMLYASQPYQALNSGVSYGWLRLARGSAIDNLGPADIAIFLSIPNEIGRLAGVITEAPQTPLSHVNLRARQDGIPNAYLRDASVDPTIALLIGKPVQLEVRPSGLILSESTAEEVTSWLESLRPKEITQLSAGLSEEGIRSLEDLTHEAWISYGAKAANLGELGKFIPEYTVTKGFAVPFSWFDQAMNASGLDSWIAVQLADSRMIEREWRNATLKEIRRRVRQVGIPRERIDALESWRAQFPDGQPLRCRSSANSEDLLNFSGAGLHNSYTHRPDEGELVHSIRQVWASLWTERAFEEREFYRIDHLSAKMGVLVHPNFDDEIANGVAVAANLFTTGAPGYTINAQFGEDLVTNPGADAVPEEWLTTATGEFHWQGVKMRASSLAASNDESVLSLEEIASLSGLLQTITAHFKTVTGAVSPRFAMEIEFKVTVDGDLVIKQARPWVR